MRNRLVVTGGNGFIASYFIRINKSFFNISPVYKSHLKTFDNPEGLLVSNNRWDKLHLDTDVIIHMAAAAHLINRNTEADLRFLRETNIGATLNLARQAAEAGVKRFIFLSSIGVNGPSNSSPFTPYDSPNPTEPYAKSKWEAEQGLMQIAEQTGMEVVIIRPPLVYGPNAPGNFGRLVRWVEKGVPLPLGAVHNRRTLVGLDNLVDLIRVCIDHPAAANRVLLAGDDEDVSTTQILKEIAAAMGKPSRLIPIPESLLWAGGSVLGKKAMAEKVLGSLQVDISETKRLLDWAPPYSFAEGMKRCFE